MTSTTNGQRLDHLKFKSPSIVMPRMQEMSKHIRALRNKNYRLEAVINMMKNDQVHVSNMNAEVMFDGDEIKRLYQQLLDKGKVTQNEVFEYLFQECMAVHARIKAEGKNNGHRYSGLMIQFACMLRARCLVDLYEFFCKAFNLPPNGTLCQYGNANSTCPDGLMMQTIIQIADIFDKQKIPLGDWGRHVNMGWDSHVIKDLLGTPQLF